MGEPTVTVMCSSYNSSQYVDKYCESLNNQLLKSFRLVVVDASSCDDSLKKFKSWRFREGIDVEIVECQTKISVYEG